MANEKLGRGSVGADAACCAITGAILTAASGPIARWAGVPRPAVAAVGIGAAAWSGFVARSASQSDWESGVRAVAAANALAAAALATVARRHPRRAMRFALGATAVEVGAFAAVQIASLVVPPADDSDGDED